MPRITVQLLDAGGFVLDVAITDANGDYCFTNIEPNETYSVAFVPPSFGATITMFSAEGADQDVDLTTGVTTSTYTPTDNETINDVDAGFMGLYSIGNQVWADVDNDGLFDSGESAFANVPVQLIADDGTTVLATTTTDVNGRYLFKYLQAGSYYVEAEVPTGYESSADIASTSTPNALDNDDNGVGSATAGYTRSQLITLANNAGSPGDANWTEADHGIYIMQMQDPTSNPKAYYTVDFGFYEPCPIVISTSIVEANIEVCGTMMATFNYTIVNGPASLSHDGVGSLSTSSLPDGTGTFTYTPGVGDAGNTVTITATVADPDGTGPCMAVSDMATVTVNALPDLSVTSPITNACPATTVDLTDVSVTGLTDGNSTVGTISYHTVANPANSTDQLVATPTMAATGATYYIRKETAANCVDIVPIVVNTVNCACPAPPSVVITQSNVDVCGTMAATFDYTVANGPASLSHDGAGSLSTISLANGTSTFTYTPAAVDAGNTVTITASIADPDGGGPCSSSMDIAMVTVNALPDLSVASP
ncbi:MAG: SdrD B-like domain-containing protein, partial [Saprospiraceae bacterium]